MMTTLDRATRLLKTADGRTILYGSGQYPTERVCIHSETLLDKCGRCERTLNKVRGMIRRTWVRGIQIQLNPSTWAEACASVGIDDH